MRLDAPGGRLNLDDDPTSCLSSPVVDLGSARRRPWTFIDPVVVPVVYLCRSQRDLAEVGFVRYLPAERLMRTPLVVPVEEFGET